jgi:hypothetical protein
MDASVVSESSMREESWPSSCSSFAAMLPAPCLFFSGVGQMPSCSYRSKKLELVGGALRLMLVDLDRGRSTAPDALRWMVVVAPN